MIILALLALGLLIILFMPKLWVDLGRTLRLFWSIGIRLGFLAIAAYGGLLFFSGERLVGFIHFSVGTVCLVVSLRGFNLQDLLDDTDYR